MEITITVNLLQLAAIMGMTQTMVKNLGEGVPTAIRNMLTAAAKVASNNTHRGATKRLQAGWRVDQQKFNFSLYNIMPYAAEEFRRPGDKLRGSPPLGPHNIVPMLVDLVTANIENIIGKAIFAGVTR